MIVCLSILFVIWLVNSLADLLFCVVRELMCCWWLVCGILLSCFGYIVGA